MRQQRILRFMMLMPLLVLADPFILNGSWRPIRSQGQRFEVEKNKIISISDRGSVSMEYKWEEGEPILMDLSNLVILKKPVDWYNILKYSKHLGYINHIKEHGMSLRVHFIDATSERVKVEARIGSRDLRPFYLVREEIPSNRNGSELSDEENG